MVSLLKELGWIGGLVGGIVGIIVGLLFRMFIIAVFSASTPSFDALLTRTLTPTSTADLLRLIFVPLPFTVLGVALGIVYSRRPERESRS